jgi:hypothetical protein
MKISNCDKDGTLRRQAFRAGWLAALRDEAHVTPHESAELDFHWSQGFQDGTGLRQAWKKAKSTPTI